MLRTLPVVGHPIRLRAIFQAFLRNSNEGIFLKELTSDSRIFLLSSGSAALTLSLRSLKHRSSKRQVIVPAYTCPSVLASVIKAGLEPVLCDLKPNSFQMDLDQLASKTGSYTLAVIAVHLFGIPENIPELRELTLEKGVILIEDAAQAFGNRMPAGHLTLDPIPSPLNSEPSTLNAQRYLGTFGDLAIFSFGRGKPLSLLAGGAILTNNPELQEPIQEFYDSVPQPNNSLFTINYLLNLFLYSIFYHPRFYWIPQGIPWLKLGETIFTTEFEVERINHNVIKLGKNLILNFDGIRKKRLELTRIYTEKLKTLRKEFAFFPEFDGEDIALLRFPLIFKNEEKRNCTLAELKKRGLGATGMYPVSLNEQNGVKPYLPGHESYPHAKFISQRILTLPLHEHVRIEDINLICEIIEKSVGVGVKPTKYRKERLGERGQPVDIGQEYSH